MTGLTGQALADAVIEHVLMHPEQHDQGVVMCHDIDKNERVHGVRCGSVGCLAGWAIELHYGYALPLLRACEFWTTAAFLLEVDAAAFHDEVYDCDDKSEAIANLKELMNAAPKR